MVGRERCWVISCISVQLDSFIGLANEIHLGQGYFDNYTKSFLEGLRIVIRIFSLVCGRRRCWNHIALSYTTRWGTQQKTHDWHITRKRSHTQWSPYVGTLLCGSIIMLTSTKDEPLHIPHLIRLFPLRVMLHIAFIYWSALLHFQANSI